MVLLLACFRLLILLALQLYFGHALHRGNIFLEVKERLRNRKRRQYTLVILLVLHVSHEDGHREATADRGGTVSTHNKRNSVHGHSSGSF